MRGLRGRVRLVRRDKRIGDLGSALGWWCALFVLMHVAWLLGWRAGLTLEILPVAERTAARTYVWLSALLVVVLGGLAWRARKDDPTSTDRGTLVLLRGGFFGCLAAGATMIVLAVVHASQTASLPEILVGEAIWYAVAALLCHLLRGHLLHPVAAADGADAEPGDITVEVSH